MQEFQEGAIFAGRYRIVRKIAAGGMGAVYEAVHIETERRRALKVMLPHLLHSPELRDRFKREARIAAHIESEFIVDVSDAGVDEATEMPYLVMELLRGEELSKRLARLGRLPPVEVVTYLRQVALALDKTHRAAIVHRDLKPENLYLTESDEGLPRIKILDFGVAKLVAESSTQANATRSLGTPLYMSPEQYLTRPITGAADIYSLGLLAYTCLVGAAYWAEEARANGSVVAFGMIAVHGPQEAASVRAARRRATLSPGFDAWFARATAVNPADRFPTATSAVQSLAEVLKGALVEAPVQGDGRAPPPGPDQASSLGENSSEVTQLLPPKIVDPSAGAEVLPGLVSREPSAPLGALGVTATRTSRNRTSATVVVVLGVSVALLCFASLFYMTYQRPVSAERPVAAPSAAATTARPAASELPAAPPADSSPAQNSAELAEPKPVPSVTASTPSAAPAPSAPSAPSAPLLPIVAGPDAGAKRSEQPKSQTPSLFNND
jgi:serine/threonine-protein kinase